MFRQKSRKSGEGRPDTRRRRSSRELGRAGDDAGALGTVLAHLLARRLIAVGAEVAMAAAAVRVPFASADGGPEIVERHVDLAHDTLITGWPALTGWVAERRDDRRVQPRQLPRRYRKRRQHRARLGDSAR